MLPPLPVVLSAIGTALTLGEYGKKIYSWFSDDEPVEETATPKRVQKKVRDYTKFTQTQYDFICESHAELKKHNALQEPGNGERVTLKELSVRLNWALGLDKSERSFARIWDRKIDRDTLAPGVPVQLPTHEMPGNT